MGIECNPNSDSCFRQTRLVLTHIYTAILKLAHPLCPFITEELWGYFPAAQRQPALITASWPRAAGNNDATSDASADVAAFERLQAAVRLVRNCRAEYGVEPGRRVAATIKVADPQLRAALESEADVIALLAKLDADKVVSFGGYLQLLCSSYCLCKSRNGLVFCIWIAHTCRDRRA